ncbi:MAG: hypothetical protein AAB870_00435, partial [Patescibacteria group bacterium]
MKESTPQIQKALDWVSMGNGIGFLLSDEHCPTRDVFQARADKLVIECANNLSIGENASLLGLVVGEIGNNTFDHNLGNWRDERGAYFVYDAEQRIVVIADRGQGVLTTLRQARSSIADDCEALTVAFTETLSGRAPERRGNGLKLVAKVVQEQQWKLEYHSGRGSYIIDGASTCTTKDDELKGM